jgi:hypothetical protein
VRTAGSFRARALGIAVLGFAAAFAALPAGCGADNKNPFIVQFDGGAEDGRAGGDGAAQVDPTIGGPCSEDAQCDDLLPCTFDRCDKTISRCRNTPDDAQCADGMYCNGQEKCVLRQGCVPGPVVTCQDSDGCTIDRCIEETKQCEHVPRDSDGDGDVDDHCSPNRDCDDTDPTVSSTRAEICGNSKDDNCNGEIDEEPCARPANDVCETAALVTAPGTLLLTSVAAKRDYATTCTVTNPGSARDIVLAIKVPDGGGPRDVLVRAETSTPPNDVAVAIQAICGAAASELGCGFVASANAARAIARSVAAGTTVYAVVTTQTESKVDVTVDLPPGTSPPTNEGCGAPEPVTIEQPFSVSIVDAKRDLESTCQTNTGELTYSFALSEKRDVRIFASTTSGPGAPIVSIRGLACTTERSCRVGSTPPVFVRSLEPGTYVFTVAGSTQLDANVVVKTYPPTIPPGNQFCASAPALPIDTTFVVDLSAQEDTIANGCLGGGSDAAYNLDLTQPSDVLVVARVPNGDVGGLSINLPMCEPTDLLECAVGGGAPMRVSQRNLPVGNFKVVIADQKGLSAELVALVRPTVVPVTVTSDACVDPVLIPETGGYFIGDTATATANFNAGCDAPGQAIGGAKDHLLKLVLSQRRRVIFDMTGSALTTVLDVRQGNPCPGVEVENGCATGLGARSFLDLVLDPGTYWVQVDGYNGTAGAWNLDVRMLPPPP